MEDVATQTPAGKPPRYVQLIVTTLLGAMAHTGVCWIALQLDFFRGSTEVFNGLFSVIWAGHIVLTLSLLVGVNRRFRDQSLSLPVILWSTASLLATAYYVDQVRLCVMILFFAILQTGVFRLQFKAFVALSSVTVLAYGGIIYLVARNHPEAIDVTGEVIQWAAFTMITVGAVMVAGEISSIRVQLNQRNEQLEGIVDRIQDMAIRDELTGLYNRRHAMERLGKIREMANRDAFDFYCLYVDLDFFKRVNDQYGHHVGDEVLRIFSETTRGLLTQRDFAARLGGEEFLVVLVKTSAEEALAFSERLRQAIEDAKYPSASDLQMTASIGLARFRKGEILDGLLARADEALYRAKNGGRNRVSAAAEIEA